MDKQELLLGVQEIFRDVFDDGTMELTYETTAEDIDEWDSLSHIQLIVAIERKFNIKLMSNEILSWDNIGEMLDAILAKL